jgi:hypothetical protein
MRVQIWFFGIKLANTLQLGSDGFAIPCWSDLGCSYGTVLSTEQHTMHDMRLSHRHNPCHGHIVAFFHIRSTRADGKQGNCVVLASGAAGWCQWLCALDRRNEMMSRQAACVNVVTAGLKLRTNPLFCVIHAGTCSAQAEFLLRGQLLALLSAKRRAPGGSTSNAVAAATAAAAAGVATGASFGFGYLPPSAACIGQLDKAALEDAIVVVLLSLSLVMAGSGHLPTFRLIQMLSRRVAAPLRPPSQAATPDGQPGGPIAAVLGGAGVGTNSLHYGHQLAVSLAAGLLFLSGGRSSLSTSNEAIAALLIALYPVWPCTPTDQRCHLQVCVCRCIALAASVITT